ncbi:Rpn family recombination-promoting nuclease/putative transposase [Candidatus Regiella insecticola]|uniref:ISNCY family transposase n=1 Tax=Candidatus Regiella insecticola TaxID=138073 RepID=A0A6L2ZL06_9ENTR|nr:Rpn family recombination-promoting nuclease/putative transposase [Candidatus Regiella insecticola]GFN45426.1 ISNCY family transposase [Candidatus Regiella insecticola]
MSKISKPHDCLFKGSLQHKQVMLDWLVHHLPKETLALIDTDTLVMVPNEYVPQWPDTLYSDIVYSCKIGGKPGYIYIAAEHQSSDDEMMAFRILCYVVELMNNHLKQGHKKLPIVLPLVLYHGEKSPYPYSTKIWDCFENPELAKAIALKPFQLIDLTVMSDEEINQHGLASVMEMLFKHYRQRQSPLSWLEALLSKGKMTTIYTQVSPDYFKDVLRYFIEICGKANEAGTDELDKALALWVQSVPEQAQEDIMTFAQQLEKRGEERGMQQGEKKASLKIAKQLLDSHVDRALVKVATGLSDEELDTLLH